MKDSIVNIKDMTYSREIYETKPRPFVSAFIYIFLTILILTLAWTYLGEIDLVSQGNGVVRPNQLISTTRTQYSGNIINVDVVEGQQVVKGERLYEINHDLLLLQEEELQAKLKDENERIIGLRSFVESIIAESNQFDNESTYKEYYQTKYDGYLANMTYLAYQSESNRLQLAQSDQSQSLGQQVSTTENELYYLRQLRQSILENHNYVTNTKYNQEFEKYISQDAQFINESMMRLDTYEKTKVLFEGGIVALNEMEEAKFNHDQQLLSHDQYKTNYLANLDSNIKTAEEQIKQYRSNLSSANVIEERIEYEAENNTVAIDKFRLDTLVNINDEIEASKNMIQSLENNLKTLILEIDKAIITAPKGGIVHIVSDVTEGDLVTLNQQLAIIIPGNESTYTIDIALPNQEVANIKIGDVIKFQFAALPYKEYGEFLGTVTSIGADIGTDSNNSSYYLVKASLNAKEGTSYKGETREIKVGMTCKAYIVTEQKKILYWLLEKINLSD